MLEDFSSNAKDKRTYAYTLLCRSEVIIVHLCIKILEAIGVSEISIFSEPTLCPSFLGLIDVPALKFKSSTNIKEFVRFILVKGHVSWTFVQHSGKLPSLLNSGLLSIVCCPIAMKLISAVVCTQPIGLSSYMGLIYVSSACAILPVNM
ncbi:hypothetical protein Tco_0567668 [Tanacetum coccineum]